MTQVDKERLEANLSAMRALDRQLVERIAEARAQGDLRENADYHASREDKSINDAKIRELVARLAGVQVVDQSEMPADMIFLGAEVTLEDASTGAKARYKIVSSLTDGDDLRYREVTATGPMGQALMKARVGETVRVNLPKGERRLTVIEIHTEG